MAQIHLTHPINPPGKTPPLWDRPLCPDLPEVDAPPPDHVGKKWCWMVYGFKTNHKYGWNRDITRERIGIWWEKNLYMIIYVEAAKLMCPQCVSMFWVPSEHVYQRCLAIGTAKSKISKTPVKGTGRTRGLPGTQCVILCLILMGNPCHSPNLWFQVKIRLPLRESALFRSI